MEDERLNWPGSRFRRSRFGWFVRNNAFVLGLDLSILVLWILIASEIFTQLSWPRWTYYALLFCGMIVYVLISPEWEFPDD